MLQLFDVVWVLEYTIYYDQDETFNGISVFTSEANALEAINRIYANGRGDRVEFQLYLAKLIDKSQLKVFEREIPQPPLVTKMYEIVPFSPEVKG